MPKGRGKKPQSKRKASQKSSTKKIREILEGADRSKFKSRIPSSQQESPMHDPSFSRAGSVSTASSAEANIPIYATAAPSHGLYQTPEAQMPFFPHPSSGFDYYNQMTYPPFAYSHFPGAGPSQCHDDERQPFFLTFVKGNISRCAGCGLKDLRQVDGKPHPPPNDLCVQHKEKVLFENPRSGNYQLSKDLRNVYVFSASPRNIHNSLHLT